MKKSFIDYLNSVHVPYNAVDITSKRLMENGFLELDLTSEWELKPGKSYFVKVYGTTLVAFSVGAKYTAEKGPHITMCHTDHPCFRVKPNPEIEDKGYMKLDVEAYGGMIHSTWLDRPLSIAGMVTLATDDIYEPECRFIDWNRPVITIPNVAIHMNRDINKGVEYNPQTELLPIAGTLSDELGRDDFLLKAIAKELKIEKDRILDFDLYIYNYDSAEIIGLQENLISSPRLDNLSSCFACMIGIIESDRQKSEDRLNISVFYDNEEVGSRSKQGADSVIFGLIYDKIHVGLGLSEAKARESMLKGMAFSVDVAHAYHPNYPGKSDPKNICRCNDGVVLKLNYSQKYATDTKAVAIVEQLAKEYDIPYQKYVNRSDIPGGGTIGSIFSSYMPIPTVDMGVGILAMHSSRELMGAEDIVYLTDLVRRFYE